MRYLSVRYSVPEWILEIWRRDYDDGTLERICAGFLEERPTVIRCNLRRQTVEELVKRLEEEHVTVERHPYLPYALMISGYDYLAGLESFQDGAFQVQDISSMLVAEIAAPKRGDTVIDVCAAPGGKALHLADKLEETGSVEARDLTDYKVGLIKENIGRSGFANLRAVKMDALERDEASVDLADIVIADLPCSGLGVLSKKTDLKYKMTGEAALELADLQRRMLDTVQSYVREGGALVYSTCTIHRKENLENVRWFLKEHPQFEQESVCPYLCGELRTEVREGCLQLLPGIHKSDGFFIAKFRRKKK